MTESLNQFERIVRRSYEFTEESPKPAGGYHPFEERNIHESLPPKVRKLFDDGHYAEATFEAFKFVDKEVQRLSGEGRSGFELMMSVFGGNSPKLQLTEMISQSDQDEQKGYQFIFAGTVCGIRNPRAHEVEVEDMPDVCLDHLSIASMLLRRLQEAGYALSR